MTTVHTLASGSSGNALVCSCGPTHLLLDAGISCRRIAASLGQLGLAPAGLSAILITHTHSDHISGLATLLKRTQCPILATDAACRQLSWRLAGIESRLLPLPLCVPFSIGEIAVTAFPTSHDSPGSCGFRFDTADGAFGLLTDSGYVTEEAADILPGVDLAVLEANHDVDALRSGPYPYYLKQRILGPEGHLSNDAAAEFAVTLARSGAAELVLAHLSRENTTPAMAENAVLASLSAAALTPILSVAPRETMSRAYLVRRTVCKR